MTKSDTYIRDQQSVERMITVYDHMKRKYVTVKVCMEIDWQLAAKEIGTKAYRNGSGVSKRLGSAITGKIRLGY